MIKSYKSKIALLVLLVTLIVITVFSTVRYRTWRFTEERSNLTLGNLNVSLPNGPPEVTALVKLDSRSRRLVSYTYGFRYPSMHLYTKEDFHEWARIGDGSDWVRVEAKTAPKPSCNVYVFSEYTNPDFSSIRIHLASSVGSPERYRYTVMIPSDPEFGLNHITLPPDPVLWDSKSYYGVSDVYSSGPPQCAEIACDLRKDLKTKTPNCKHTVTDLSSNVTYSMHYSGALLSNWLDIQTKAIALVTAMRKDSDQ